MPRNIALVGCGAIAKAFYLRALANRRHEFDRIWLVDPNDNVLGEACSVVDGEKARALSEIDKELQYIVIAAPNSLHFPLASEGLSRGAHVLVEKPYVIWPDDGRKLIDVAIARNRIIAVNQTRRLLPYTRELCRRIAANEFGELKSIVHAEGSKLNWPLSSGLSFARGAQRTGVIMDIGVHAIDFIQTLFQPKWQVDRAIHDGFNGPEGLAEIQLAANGSPVSIRLSRYQKQENMTHLSFERADVFVSTFDWNVFFIEDKAGHRRRVTTQPMIKDETQLAEQLLANFVAAGEGREFAICDAASSLPVIEVLDEIYRTAVHYPETPGTV